MIRQHPRTWLFVVLLCVAGGVEAGLRAPLQGTGELPFIVDMPVFVETDGRTRMDVAVRVDHDDLRLAGAEDRSRDVAVTLKLAREGLVAVDTTQVFRVESAGPTRGTLSERFDVLEISVRVPEGRWAATVELVTLDQRNDRGRAQGVVDVPRWPVGTARLSDPEFRIATAAGSLPHPERLYGIAQDTLEAYVEISGAEAGRLVRLDVEIRDPEYGRMDTRTIDVTPRAAIDAVLVRVPLALLPDGNYLLRLVPQWVDDVAVEAEFVVSWRIERALQARDDVLVEAEIALTADEFERFQRLSRPAQVQAMQRFWDERDPTPGTPRNELYDRFLVRVAHAARFYGNGTRPGPLTDRGKTYIRFGPPDEVEVNVLPSSGQDINSAIEQVHDAFAIEVQGFNARSTVLDGDYGGQNEGVDRAPDAIQDPDRIQDLRRNRLRIGRESSYELWRYTSVGDPLFDHAPIWTEDIDLRFLFVDRTGTGDYRLDYSNTSSLD